MWITASTPRTAASKAPGYPRSVSALLSIGGTTYLKDVLDNGKFKVVRMRLEDSFQIVGGIRGADDSSDSVISLQ